MVNSDLTGRKNQSELVDQYLNGNISYVKKKLKYMSKVKLLDFVEELNNRGRDMHQAVYETKRLVR